MAEYEAKMRANALKALERKAAAMGIPTQSAAHPVGRWIEAVASRHAGDHVQRRKDPHPEIGLRSRGVRG